MKHTITLDDMELAALYAHLEGQSEMMVESRLNSDNPRELPDREEVLLNLVYTKVFEEAYKDMDTLNLNIDRIYKYK
tara:strand:+ start:1590 stop:1820 length:231 start_codon:yes stop_codon:yes gene_type:complete